MMSERMTRYETSPENPEHIKGIFLDVGELVKELQKIRERESKVRVGMIEGSFNVIHTGHLQFMTEAKKQCNVLVVMVERPKSVSESKGYGRTNNTKPLISLGDKLRTLKRSQEYEVDWLEFKRDAESGKRFTIDGELAHAGVDYVLVNPYTSDYQDQGWEDKLLNTEMKIKPDVLFVSGAETHLASKEKRADKVGYVIMRLSEYPRQALNDKFEGGRG